MKQIIGVTILLIYGFTTPAMARFGDGTQWGGFDINAYIEAGIGSDSNLFLQEADEIEDEFFRLEPQIDITRDLSPDDKFYLSYNGEYYKYFDVSSEDTDTHDGVIGFDFKAQDFYSTIKYDYLVTDQKDGVLETNRYNRSIQIPSILVGFDFNRIALEGAYQIRFKGYSNPDLADREFEEPTFTAAILYHHSEKTDFVLEYNDVEIEYDISGVRDGDYSQVRAGVIGNVTQKITGTIKVGAQDRDYDILDLGYDDPVVFSQLVWEFTEKQKLNLEYHISAEESPVRNTIFYEYDRLSVDYYLETDRDFFFQLGGYLENDDFTELVDVGRDDDVTNIYIVLGYEFNDAFLARVGFDRLERDSTVDTRDYDRKRWYVGGKFIL